MFQSILTFYGPCIAQKGDDGDDDLVGNCQQR